VDWTLVVPEERAVAITYMDFMPITSQSNGRRQTTDSSTNNDNFQRVWMVVVQGIHIVHVLWEIIVNLVGATALATGLACFHDNDTWLFYSPASDRQEGEEDMRKSCEKDHQDSRAAETRPA